MLLFEWFDVPYAMTISYGKTRDIIFFYSKGDGNVWNVSNLTLTIIKWMCDCWVHHIGFGYCRLLDILHFMLIIFMNIAHANIFVLASGLSIQFCHVYIFFFLVCL